MKIAVIGAGNMGMAFSNAFVKNKMLSQDDLLLVEVNPPSIQKLSDLGFNWISGIINEEICKCQLVILAVKPQDFNSLTYDLSRIISKDQIVLSIMAGLSIQGICTSLNHLKIVRCMPNTPAQLGEGITGYYMQNLNEEEESIVKRLLECTGSAVKVNSEELLNAVTAISGSGPAYFYYFLKVIVESGVALGLSEVLAHQLACETMKGAYSLIKGSDQSFDNLIKAVTSKGGTTEAALVEFNNFKIDLGIKAGILKAHERAVELSKNN